MLEENRDDLIHVGTNYLTNNVKLLNKKIEKQISKKAPSSNLEFSSIIVRKDKQILDKSLSETNAQLENFCLQNKNKNINESCLGKKKLHVSNKAKGVFAKILMSYMNRDGVFFLNTLILIMMYKVL